MSPFLREAQFRFHFALATKALARNAPAKLSRPAHFRAPGLAAQRFTSLEDRVLVSLEVAKKHKTLLRR